jgi:hypothetical protein
MKPRVIMDSRLPRTILMGNVDMAIALIMGVAFL